MKREHSPKKEAVGMIIGLTMQYLLGMSANLFVQFPQNAKEGQLWVFAWRQVPIAIHIVLGILLSIGAVHLGVDAFKSQDRRWKIVSLVSAVAIFAAILGGALFIPSQNNVYSLLMAVSFIIALLSYGIGISTTHQ